MGFWEIARRREGRGLAQRAAEGAEKSPLPFDAQGKQKRAQQIAEGVAGGNK
jgi:hypothetical protein